MILVSLEVDILCFNKYLAISALPWLFNNLRSPVMVQYMHQSFSISAWSIENLDLPLQHITLLHQKCLELTETPSETQAQKRKKKSKKKSKSKICTRSPKGCQKALKNTTMLTAWRIQRLSQDLLMGFIPDDVLVDGVWVHF